MAGGDEVVLKPANREDAALLHGMLQRLAEGLGKSGQLLSTPELLEQYGFGETPFFEAIIAWRSEEALGFILFFNEFSSWRGRPGIYVQDFYVSPEARGLGLGRRLTAAAARVGIERGAVYMRLAVHGDNESGLGFYEANDFVRVEDEIIMLLEEAAFTGLGVENC